MLELLFVLVVVLFVTYPIWSEVFESHNNKKKKEELEQIPIEVFKYTFHMYLNDGTDTRTTDILWTSVNFEKYVEDCVLCNDTFIVGNIIVNSANISRIKFIGSEKKLIKPSVAIWSDEPYVMKYYSNDYVNENEIKKEGM